MKPISYIVEYRDSPEAKERVFGTFASESVADFFRAALPMPLKGGYCRRKMLQPFAAHEAHAIAQTIVRERASQSA